MKKILTVSLVIMMVSCASKADKSGPKPLYEVLTQQNDGGAQVRFFEILTESREIKMLQNDEALKKKIKPEDVNNANFIILNAGEKNSGGHSISVLNVEETPDKIIVTVKEDGPQTGEMATSVMSYPYAVIKVNSKKPIEVK